GVPGQRAAAHAAEGELQGLPGAHLAVAPPGRGRAVGAPAAGRVPRRRPGRRGRRALPPPGPGLAALRAGGRLSAGAAGSPRSPPGGRRARIPAALRPPRSAFAR
ncbi:MAG: hypothetical protein ACK559_19305, partial [bacterium]